MSLQCDPSSLESIGITVWEDLSFEEFQDGHRGGHLGCRNGTNLTVLNLHVSLMLPTKFQLDLTYCSGADVVSRFSRWPQSWILERKDFAILNLHVTPIPPSLASIRLIIQEQTWFEDFQDGHSGHLGYWNTGFLQFWICMLLRCLPSSFSSIRLTVWEEMSFEDFQDGWYDSHLGYRNRVILGILNLHVTRMPPTKFGLYLT